MDFSLRSGTRAVLVVLFSLSLTACGGSGGSSIGDTAVASTPSEGDTLPGSGTGSPPPASGESRPGESYNVYIQSFDAKQIAFTVHEPTLMEGGATYPLVLEGHGFGGSKTETRTGTIGTLLDEGYGVISIDQRGFGETGGTIRVMDPDFEGRYLIAIVDWAEANLPWLAYDGGNLVLGAIGGSYGGGYQLLLNAVDPDRRLDAIVPDITWHDLRYSLFPPEDQEPGQGSLKGTWVTALFGAGTAGSTQSEGFDPVFNEAIVQALTTNTVEPEVIATFYEHSPAFWCDGNTMSDGGTPGGLNPVNVLFSQGFPDSLFNVTEAWRNYECYQNMPGALDVRFYGHNNGHVVPPPPTGPSQDCGAISHVDATLAWFDEYLRGNAGAADAIPEICMSLSPGDDITADSFQVGGTEVAVGSTPVILSPQTIPIYTAPAEQIMAGIPQLSIEVSGAGLDPIVYIGLVTGDTTAPPWVAADQMLHPLRGYGIHELDMGGVAERLSNGETVSVVAYLIEPQEYAAVVGSGTVTIEGTISLPILP